jgi:hypothetical protein
MCCAVSMLQRLLEQRRLGVRDATTRDRARAPSAFGRALSVVLRLLSDALASENDKCAWDVCMACVMMTVVDVVRPYSHVAFSRRCTN